MVKAEAAPRMSREEELRSRFFENGRWRSPELGSLLPKDRHVLMDKLPDAEDDAKDAKDKVDAAYKRLQTARTAHDEASAKYWKRKDQLDVIKLAIQDEIKVTD